MSDQPEHLTLDSLAELLLRNPELQEWLLPHLASACRECAAVLETLAGLRTRFSHWDPCVLLVEGPVVDELYQELSVQGDAAARRAAVEQEERFRTWCLAVVVLERSLAAAQEDPVEARDLALLAVQILGKLSAIYNPETLADLSAVAYAAAAAAAGKIEGGRGEALELALLTGLEIVKGSDDPAVRAEVEKLLGEGR